MSSKDGCEEEEVVVEEEAAEAGRGVGGWKRGYARVCTAADGAHGLGGGGQPRDDLGLELLKALEARAVVLEAARRARLAAVVVVRDVGGDGVEEVVVVRDEYDGDALQPHQVLGQPVDRVAVEVVGRLVEQQQLWLGEG